MKNIYTYWQMNWAALGAILLMTALYIGFQKFRIKKPFVFFFIALLLLALCFFSPLHVLSEEYLFSAHMTVHVVLLLIIGPLLVLSLQEGSENNKVVTAISKLLHKKPFIGWMVGVGIMWFWHLPFVFNYGMMAMHTNSGVSAIVHAAESISLLIAGMLFSWPIISPVKQYRINALSGVVYLFTACIGCSLLGLLITFAPTGLYHHFLSATDTIGLNTVILSQWGINQTMDQQIAGLIMWVPCCLLYVVDALYLLHIWFNEKELSVLEIN